MDLIARSTRGVSYPRTTATTDPRRRRDDDDATTTTRRREPDDANENISFASRVAAHRVASHRARVERSIIIINNHRARGARYAATHPSPRTARATRFAPRAREDASNASTRIETRTWTLVALKAATRPTKEEARSADIVSVLGMTIESIARAGSIESSRDAKQNRVVRYLRTDRDFVSSSMSVPWSIRSFVRRIHIHGDWMGFEGYTLVA